MKKSEGGSGGREDILRRENTKLRQQVYQLEEKNEGLKLTLAQA